jgi:hypothetical protein
MLYEQEGQFDELGHGPLGDAQKHTSGVALSLSRHPKSSKNSGRREEKKQMPRAECRGHETVITRPAWVCVVRAESCGITQPLYKRLDGRDGVPLHIPYTRHVSAPVFLPSPERLAKKKAPPPLKQNLCNRHGWRFFVADRALGFGDGDLAYRAS